MNVTDKEMTRRSTRETFSATSLSIASPGKTSWTWIGGWRLDTSLLGSDRAGWIYGTSADDLRQSALGEKKEYRVRRRTWRRLRVLTSYEGMVREAVPATPAGRRINFTNDL